MFRFLDDVDDNPYMMDPFAAHRRQMRSMFGSFGFDPFPLSPQIQSARTPMQVQPQAGALAPFGMMGMERFSGSPSCQSFSSSTIISYSSDSGAPKVYQQTREIRTAPGGIRETRQSLRDSESGVERMSIGHHIGDRAHVLERSRNAHTGDQEHRQDFINLEESEAEAFDEEWRRGVGRYMGPNARGLDYGRSRRTAAGQLALPAPPNSNPSSSPRPPHRPRYDW
ncbi:myeloid leukemia factor 2 isoform X3 [Neoarius graeffei]|uniref:myeloid leukemia factor 2 isoform X3 n=1 Tax=Neoarius graeffei TaxID=443677 RepID=UPI00298CEA40|nr:myeloid leukemia factor 2 isoform X3 [Neoarius graeffei]